MTSVTLNRRSVHLACRRGADEANAESSSPTSDRVRACVERSCARAAVSVLLGFPRAYRSRDERIAKIHVAVVVGDSFPVKDVRLPAIVWAVKFKGALDVASILGWVHVKGQVPGSDGVITIHLTDLKDPGDESWKAMR